MVQLHATRAAHPYVTSVTSPTHFFTRCGFALLCSRPSVHARQIGFPQTIAIGYEASLLLPGHADPCQTVLPGTAQVCGQQNLRSLQPT